MITKQTIAVIGAPNQTSDLLCKALAKGNYRLLMAQGKQHKVRELFNEIRVETPGADMESIDCCQQACWEADIILFAVPCMEQTEIVYKIKEVANQKIVLCIPSSIDQYMEGSKMNAAQLLQGHLPNSKVVNACYAQSGSNILLDSGAPDALQTVQDLIRAIGFFPLDKQTGF